MCIGGAKIREKIAAHAECAQMFITTKGGMDLRLQLPLYQRGRNYGRALVCRTLYSIEGKCSHDSRAAIENPSHAATPGSNAAHFETKRPLMTCGLVQRFAVN